MTVTFKQSTYILRLFFRIEILMIKEENTSIGKRRKKKKKKESIIRSWSLPKDLTPNGVLATKPMESTAGGPRGETGLRRGLGHTSARLFVLS